MTTTDSESKSRTITLTDAAPVRIRDADWPVIAQSTWYVERHECDATRVWWLKVRQHADGRVIVYGGLNTRWEGEHNRRAGIVLDKGEYVVGAIKSVAALVGADKCQDACISSLPPVEI